MHSNRARPRRRSLKNFLSGSRREARIGHKHRGACRDRPRKARARPGSRCRRDPRLSRRSQWQRLLQGGVRLCRHRGRGGRRRSNPGGHDPRAFRGPSMAGGCPDHGVPHTVHAQHRERREGKPGGGRRCRSLGTVPSPRARPSPRTRRADPQEQIIATEDDDARKARIIEIFRTTSRHRQLLKGYSPECAAKTFGS
jgi:hypothetical protein